MVHTGINNPGRFLLNRPIRINGANNAVPEKLVNAKVTRCSMLIIEKTNAAAPKTTINILVIASARRSSEVSRDLNYVPSANICESEVEMAAAIRPIKPRAAITGN